jgi:hypothetical protein
VTAVPRPKTKLSDDQQRLLIAAVEAAKKSDDSHQRADADEDEAWQKIVVARKAGVPDDLLCSETGFSRATLNRKYGRRPEPDAEN